MEIERIHDEYTYAEDTTADEDTTETYQEVPYNRILSSDLRILRDIFHHEDKDIKISGAVYFDHHETSEPTMNKRFQLSSINISFQVFLYFFIVFEQKILLIRL